MINFQTAEKALKSFYLSVIAEQLNTKINPLLAKIEQTSSDVAGKEIVKLCTYVAVISRNPAELPHFMAHIANLVFNYFNIHN